MELNVDISEIIAFGAKSEAVIAHIPVELDRAGRATGLAVQRFAQSGVAVATGTAKANIRVDKVDASLSGVEIVVASTAQSAAGYPYTWVLEKGTTGDIVPVKAKSLRFEVGGKTVFTKRVKQRPARPFMAPALVAAAPFIDQQFSLAYDRLLAMWAE